MKKIIVAGNWKMNKTYLEAKEFIAKLNLKTGYNTEVILAVPSLYADTLYINSKNENVHIVLQNCSSFDDGAYTGEISARMIASLAMKYCIVGHSERRELFGETDQIISQKVNQLLLSNIKPILCIGESLSIRKENKTFDLLRNQLRLCLHDVKKKDIQNLVIAYEPIWAIGTGKTATKEEAQEVHRFIYNFLADQYGKSLAEEIPILYGGSCNEKNAEDLFRQPNIWGGLIGGASLSIESFSTIIDIADKLNDGK